MSETAYTDGITVCINGTKCVIFARRRGSRLPTAYNSSDVKFV